MTNSLKNFRNLGKKLREARESQGHNLAILAGQCNLSVVLLTAIERGDSLAFTRSQSSMHLAVQTYAKALGVEMVAAEHQDDLSDDGIYIPEFLRKK